MWGAEQRVSDFFSPKQGSEWNLHLYFTYLPGLYTHLCLCTFSHHYKYVSLEWEGEQAKPNLNC